jgi:hypothetical protein
LLWCRELALKAGALSNGRKSAAVSHSFEG